MTKLPTPPVLPALQPQEIAFSDLHSRFFFEPMVDKPFVATQGALGLYGISVIHECLFVLQRLARKHRGIDSFQVFFDPSKAEKLYFIEDGPGGAITALLPSEY